MSGRVAIHCGQCNRVASRRLLPNRTTRYPCPTCGCSVFWWRNESITVAPPTHPETPQ